jgi:hypothetical protein
MPKQVALPPTLVPRFVMREVVAAYMCVSPNAKDDMVDKGIMPPPHILIGKRKAWDLREVDAACGLVTG